MDGDPDASTGGEAITHVEWLLEINDQSQAQVRPRQERGEAQVLLLARLQRVEGEAVPVLRTGDRFPDPELFFFGLIYYIVPTQHPPFRANFPLEAAKFNHFLPLVPNT